MAEKAVTFERNIHFELQDAELDGATVPILYEGRTADGMVKDASGLDQLFEDLFRHGVVLFNWRLLQLPVRLIDYVIIHELVHIQEPHHSPAFWQAVDRALPAWRTLKDTLHNDGVRFLVFGMDSLRSLNMIRSEEQ